jgi:polyisoprenoid-binding protein YceI
MSPTTFDGNKVESGTLADRRSVTMAETNPNPFPPAALADVAGQWQLDPVGTTIELRTKAMWGLAKVRGRFSAVDGSGVVGEDATVSGTIVFDAKSIDTKNNRRDTHLRSGDFFEVDKYPTFTYSATGATPIDDDKLKVTGSLTIRDQSQPLELVVSACQPAPGRVTVTAEAQIDRRQWGMTWAKMGAGVINEVVVVAQFTRS